MDAKIERTEENNRIYLKFSEKPSEEIRNTLKSGRWWYDSRRRSWHNINNDKNRKFADSLTAAEISTERPAPTDEQYIHSDAFKTALAEMELLKNGNWEILSQIFDSNLCPKQMEEVSLRRPLEDFLKENSIGNHGQSPKKEIKKDTGLSL